MLSIVSSPPPEARSAFLNTESVKKEVRATLSQKTTLSCDVADSNTEVRWYKDGKLLTPGKAIRTESKGKSRQLLIDSIEKKDAGEYCCEAGADKLLFKIHVAGRDDQYIEVKTVIRFWLPMRTELNSVFFL